MSPRASRVGSFGLRFARGGFQCVTPDDCFGLRWHCFDVYAYVSRHGGQVRGQKTATADASVIAAGTEREREKKSHKIFTPDAYSCGRNATVPLQVTQINMHKILASLGIQCSFRGSATNFYHLYSGRIDL